MNHEERLAEIEAHRAEMRRASGIIDLSDEEKEAQHWERVWAQVEERQKEREVLNTVIDHDDHDDEAPAEKVFFADEPEWLSRHDKAFRKLKELRERRAAETDPRKMFLLDRQIEVAHEEYSLWNKRGADDLWRARERIDQHRATVGKEPYNASRRQVRKKPNMMTPKDVLANETAEQRAARERAANTTAKAAKRAALTPAPRDAINKRETEKRKARRAAAKATRSTPS